MSKALGRQKYRYSSRYVRHRGYMTANTPNSALPTRYSEPRLIHTHCALSLPLSPVPPVHPPARSPSSLSGLSRPLGRPPPFSLLICCYRSRCSASLVDPGGDGSNDGRHVGTCDGGRVEESGSALEPAHPARRPTRPHRVHEGRSQGSGRALSHAVQRMRAEVVRGRDRYGLWRQHGRGRVPRGGRHGLGAAAHRCAKELDLVREGLFQPLRCSPPVEGRPARNRPAAR